MNSVGLRFQRCHLCTAGKPTGDSPPKPPRNRRLRGLEGGDGVEVDVDDGVGGGLQKGGVRHGHSRQPEGAGDSPRASGTA